MDGSVGFQQFFLMYAKLITGLSDSKITVSETTPYMPHNTVINTGNSSLEVLDWAIWLICREMKLPKSRSIFITSSYMSRTLSTFKSEVCEVGVRLK